MDSDIVATTGGQRIGPDFPVATLVNGAVIRIDLELGATVFSWLNNNDNGAKVFRSGLILGHKQLGRETTDAAYAHRRYAGTRGTGGMRRKVLMALDNAGAFAMPDAGSVIAYLETVVRSSKPGKRRFRDHSDFIRDNPAVHAVALYILWAWLPNYLSDVYDARADELEGDEDAPEFFETEERADVYHDRSQAYDEIYQQSLEHLLPALAMGHGAMRDAIDQVSDDVD